MTPDAAAILLVVGLFLLGVISPGPNFLVVVEHSMAGGFRAGLATGLGIATGDAVYAACGLLGLAALIARVGWLFAVVKLLGGMYITWIGLRLVLRARVPLATDSRAARPAPRLSRCYRTGLLTDLANPKTVVFFASIFATAYDPATPTWVAVGMWAGIVAASVLWRTGLAAAFSRPVMQALYRRARRPLEILFGALLVLFGVRLTLRARS